MKMNKYAITKPYAIAMLCVTLLSCLLLFITPFLNAFQVNLGMLDGSETGMDYITNLFESLGKDTHSKETSSNSSGYYSGYSSGYSYGYSSGSKGSSSRGDTMMLDDGLGRWILRALVVAAWSVSLIFGLKIATGYAKSGKDVLMQKMLVGVTVCMVVNALYYLFCLYFVITENEWEIFDILSGDGIVKTATHAPFVLQMLLFAGSLFLKRHWEKAIAGKCSPLFGFLSSSKGESTPATVSYAEAQPVAKQTQNEMDTLELLKKYKELLDAGILTEAEFQEKKQELLAKNERKAGQARMNTGANAEEPAETVQAEPELTRVCRECGYPLYSTQQVCPQCGASAVEKEKPKGPGMKWYYFLIYFSLFAGAVSNTIMAIVYWTGAMYEGHADLVYGQFPENTLSPVRKELLYLKICRWSEKARL